MSTLFAMMVIIVVVLMVLTSAGARRSGSTDFLRTCPRCHTPHPHHAQFCRNCGQRLP